MNVVKFKKTSVNYYNENGKNEGPTASLDGPWLVLCNFEGWKPDRSSPK